MEFRSYCFYFCVNNSIYYIYVTITDIKKFIRYNQKYWYTMENSHEEQEIKRRKWRFLKRLMDYWTFAALEKIERIARISMQIEQITEQDKSSRHSKRWQDSSHTSFQEVWLLLHSFILHVSYFMKYTKTTDSHEK